MKNRTYRITAALLAPAGALLLSTAAAQADTNGYISAIEDGGITVTDRSDALQTGYVICQTLEEYPAETVAQALVEMSEGQFDIHGTRTVVMAAAQELCPWHEPRQPVSQPPKRKAV